MDILAGILSLKAGDKVGMKSAKIINLKYKELYNFSNTNCIFEEYSIVIQKHFIYVVLKNYK